MKGVLHTVHTLHTVSMQSITIVSSIKQLATLGKVFYSYPFRLPVFYL